MFSLTLYDSLPVAGEAFKLTNDDVVQQINELLLFLYGQQLQRCGNYECIRNSEGAPIYGHYGHLLHGKQAGLYFECNDLWSTCNINRCKNRVVGEVRLNQCLEVFRCADLDKGLGVRCRDDILPGRSITDYAGEYLLGSGAETCGLMSTPVLAG
jgi:hypothetical protein